MAKKFIRKLRKTGRYSYSVILPAETIRSFKWRERQKLVLTVESRAEKIIVKDWGKNPK